MAWDLWSMYTARRTRFTASLSRSSVGGISIAITIEASQIVRLTRYLHTSRTHHNTVETEIPCSLQQSLFTYIQIVGVKNRLIGPQAHQVLEFAVAAALRVVYASTLFLLPPGCLPNIYIPHFHIQKEHFSQIHYEIIYLLQPRWPAF